MMLVRSAAALVPIGLLVALWLPWVDDEAGRTPGPLLFRTGRDAATALGWVRALLVVTTLAIALCTVAVARRWDQGVRSMRHTAAWASWAAFCCVVSAVVAVIVTVTLGLRADVGAPATGLVALGGAVILGIVARRTGTRGVSLSGADLDATVPERAGSLFGRGDATIAVAVLVIAAVLAGVGSPWWVFWRHGDATTAAPASGLGGTGKRAGGPDSPDTALWTMPADGAIPAGRSVVLLGDGSGSEGDRGGITVVDAATGDERWHYRRDDRPVSSVLVSRKDNLVVASFELDEDELYELVALDLATGQQRWSRRTDRQPAEVARGLLLIPQDGSLVALRVDDGSRAWRADNYRQCVHTVLAGGLILGGPSNCVAGPDNTLTVREARTGRFIWHKHVDTDSLGASVDDAVRVGDALVLAVSGWSPSGEDWVIAFDAGSGRELWHQARQVDQLTSMGNHLLVASDYPSKAVRALDPRTGRVQWTVHPPVRGDQSYDLITDGRQRGYVSVERSRGMSVLVFDSSGRTVSATTIPDCTDSCSDRSEVDASVGVDAVGAGVLLVSRSPYAALTGRLHRVTALG